MILKALRRLILWIAVNVPLGPLNPHLLAFGLGAEEHEEEMPDPNSGPQLPPPSAQEAAQWADGVVYAKTPDGEDVYFDTPARTWRKVRRPGPGSNDQCPRDND